MSRDTAGNKLRGKPPGTFIIRFSDGEIGGVSIAWVHGGEDGELLSFDLLIFSSTSPIFACDSHIF